MTHDQFDWNGDVEVEWAGRRDVGPAMPTPLSELLAEFRAERAEVLRCVEDGHHGRGEFVKFNGGSPWVICDWCGVKLRDAIEEDLSGTKTSGD